MDTGTLVALATLGGTVLGYLANFFTSLVTTRAAATEAKRSREHEAERLKEERENEARIRREDREAELARLRLDRDMRLADESRQGEAEAGQARREVGTALVVLAQEALQAMHLRLQDPDVAAWSELSKALGRVTAAFDAESNAEAVACLSYLRDAAAAQHRTHELQQAQVNLERFAARVRSSQG